MTAPPDAVRLLPAIEDELRSALSSREDDVARFYAMMRYQFGWSDEQFQPATVDGGKRVRPLLCLLVCEALGGDWHAAVPAAAAVEILHNFSLVHDDIEDHDRMRRHRPTLWTIAGVPHAINVGDALFAIAQRALLRLSERGVPAERTLRAALIFQETCLRLVEGQYLDMHAESLAQATQEYYLHMIQGKTGALIGASCALGGLVATGDERVVEHCRKFGEELGLAFQMTDDLLGLWGDPEITGKPAGADLKRRKKSLPVIIAQQGGGSLAESLTHAFSQPELSDAEVAALLRVMDDAGIRATVEAQGTEHQRNALISWQAAIAGRLASAAASDALETLVTNLATRRA